MVRADDWAGPVCYTALSGLAPSLMLSFGISVASLWTVSDPSFLEAVAGLQLSVYRKYGQVYGLRAWRFLTWEIHRR